MVEVNPPPNPPAFSSRFCKTAFVGCLIAVCSLVLIFPGDAPWINDEPHLLLNANAYNSTPSDVLGISLPFTIASEGLIGTRDLPYGPLAIWFYQVLLLFTHDPVVLVVIRAALVTAATAIALCWIARTLRLNPWFVPVVMISPWLWFYSRQLWDNSFTIPLSAILFAAYADFLQTRRPWSFRLTLVCCAILPLIHLMALAMVIPLLAHLAYFEIRWCLRFKWSILVVLLAFIILPAGYWSILVQAISDNLGHAMSGPPIVPETSHANAPPAVLHLLGGVFPLFGGHHVTGMGISMLMGNEWITGAVLPVKWLLSAAVGISMIAIPAVWVGMGLAVFRAGKIYRGREDVSAIDHMAMIALAVWLVQTVLDAGLKVFQLPHYYNATWIVYIFLIWLAIATVRKKWIANGLLALQAICLGFITIYVLSKIHRDGGTRTLTYGTTLANQVQVSREIESYSPKSSFEFDYPAWAQFPPAYRALRGLDGAHPGEDLPRKYLIIRFRDAYPDDARIMLEVLPPKPLPQTQGGSRG